MSRRTGKFRKKKDRQAVCEEGDDDDTSRRGTAVFEAHYEDAGVPIGHERVAGPSHRRARNTTVPDESDTSKPMEPLASQGEPSTSTSTPKTNRWKVGSCCNAISHIVLTVLYSRRLL